MTCSARLRPAFSSPPGIDVGRPHWPAWCGAGGVQWMTAGRGIIHSEMPRGTTGMLHGGWVVKKAPVGLQAADPACRLPPLLLLYHMRAPHPTPMLPLGTVHLYSPILLTTIPLQSHPLFLRCSTPPPPLPRHLHHPPIPPTATRQASSCGSTCRPRTRCASPGTRTTRPRTYPSQTTVQAPRYSPDTKSLTLRAPPPSHGVCLPAPQSGLPPCSGNRTSPAPRLSCIVHPCGSVLCSWRHVRLPHTAALPGGASASC